MKSPKSKSTNSDLLDNYYARQKNLERFSHSLDRKLKKQFTSFRLKKVLEDPEEIQESKILTGILIAIAACIPISLFITMRSIESDFSVRLIAGLLVCSTIAAVLIYSYRKIVLWHFFRDFRFAFARFEGKAEGEYPYCFLQAPFPKRNSGFGYMYYRNIWPGNEQDSKLVIQRPNEEGKQVANAVVDLKHRGELSVQMLTNGSAIEKGLPPLKEEAKYLIAEFIKNCNEFTDIDANFERVNSVNQENVQELVETKKRVKKRINLKEIWDEVKLEPKLKKELTGYVKSFNQDPDAAIKGLLLHGPPGTGKSFIAGKIAESCNCEFFHTSLSDLKGRYVGESGHNVSELWSNALKEPKAVIFIDECDAIFGKRGGINSDKFTDDIVNAFLPKWDGAAEKNNVWVIGATNRHDQLDEAILSRFEESIEIPLPTAELASEIFTSELKKRKIKGPYPKNIKEVLYGLSGREIFSISGFVSRRVKKGEKLSLKMLKEIVERKKRQGSTSVTSDATWNRLVLKDDTMERLQTVSGILQQAELFKKKGLDIPRGILLYGPPGTGKTQIARTLANESGLQFIGVTSADLKANYVGQSASKVKDVFGRARMSAPSILFIDELDIVATVRGSEDQFSKEIIGQLLQELDGIKVTTQEVFILAATNDINSIDKAIVSRFSQKIPIPLPDQRARAKLYHIMLEKKPVNFKLADVSRALAKKTDGYSGRDIRNSIETAEQKAISRSLKANNPESVSIELSDLESAIRAND